jgi:uncharacterized protein YjbI with pentapeptide repeats
MANSKQLRILQQGVKAWNDWRQEAGDIAVDLSEANLWGANLRGANLRGANLVGTDLSNTDLCGASLNNANLIDAVLHGVRAIPATPFSRTLILERIRVPRPLGVSLRVTDFSGADFSGADLSRANLNEVDLHDATLIGANLSRVSLTEVDLRGADLTGCRVYGVSAWRLKLDAGTRQHGLIITPEDEPEITTDDIEVAQFLYLLIHNEKLRKVIDTITSKVVLILGRFSKKRKAVLDAMRIALRERDLLPIIFDFSIPASRNVTETVKVLAGLASFVIADITGATEVRVELHGIVPLFPSLAVQPIILRRQSKFFSMSHLEQYRSMLPPFPYDTAEHLLANLNDCVIAPAEAKARKLQRPPATRAGRRLTSFMVSRHAGGTHGRQKAAPPPEAGG